MIKGVMKSGAMLALVAMATQAAAAPKFNLGKCLTKPELYAGMSFVTPTVLSAMVEQCKPNLAADSYLTTKGESLVTRYAYSPDKHDVALNGLIAKFVPDTGKDKMDALTLRGVVNAMLGGELRKAMTPKVCVNASELLSLLDPLPADNLYGLFDFILTKVSEGDKAKALRQGVPYKPMFCDAVPAAAPATKPAESQSL